LVDPAQRTKDWLGTVTKVTAWGGAAAEMSLTMTFSSSNDRKANFAPDQAIGRALATQGGLLAEKSRVNRIEDAQRNSHDIFFDSANEELGKLFGRLQANKLFDELTSLGTEAPK
jgi:hypothetical protein